MKVYTTFKEGVAGIKSEHYDVPVEPAEHPSLDFFEDVINFSRLYESGLLDKLRQKGLNFPEWLDGLCGVRPVVRDGKPQTPAVGDDLIVGADDNYNLGKIVKIWEFDAARN